MNRSWSCVSIITHNQSYVRKANASSILAAGFGASDTVALCFYPLTMSWAGIVSPADEHLGCDFTGLSAVGGIRATQINRFSHKLTASSACTLLAHSKARSTAAASSPTARIDSTP